jgi:hypothetical protein
MIKLTTIIKDWIDRSPVLKEHLRVWDNSLDFNVEDGSTPTIVTFCTSGGPVINILGWIKEDGVEIRPVIQRDADYGGEGPYTKWLKRYGDWRALKATDPEFFKKLRKALVSSHNWSHDDGKQCPVILK